MIVVIFLAFSLPPYLSLDPAQSRVPPPDGVFGYYALLAGHVVFGSTALISACLQIWPWFRQRYPVAHRMVGRIYVFGGVLPAGTMALTIGAFSADGPVARVLSVFLAALCLTSTIAGFRAARRRRFVKHRRWMIRSFVLTASVITTRVAGVIAYLALTLQLDTTFGGDEDMLAFAAAGITTSLGWVLPLVIVEWWLERHPRPGRR